MKQAPRPRHEPDDLISAHDFELRNRADIDHAVEEAHARLTDECRPHGIPRPIVIHRGGC
jgi:hypothetical protein